MRAALALLLTLCKMLASGASPGASLDRDRNPVVLTGSQLSTLVGLAPSSVVAFRYQGGWQQIPVQIDERDTVTFDQVYGGGYPQADIDVETYTNAGTYVDADSDPLFDADDELVFMAKTPAVSPRSRRARRRLSCLVAGERFHRDESSTRRLVVPLPWAA